MLANFKQFSNIPRFFFIKKVVKEVEPGVVSRYGKKVSKLLEKFYEYFFIRIGMNLVEEGKQEIPKEGIVYNGTTLSEDYLEGLNLTIPHFNKVSEMKKSANKTTFHKLLEGSKFLPNTVFTKEEAFELKFPIVAKPNEGHSGLGIQVFDTLEELKESKEEFDLFSEKVNIDTEWRIVMFRDKPISIVQRMPLDGSSISSKKENEELQFLYVESEMNPFKEVKCFNELVKEITEKVKLDIWCVDLAVDGKLCCELDNNPYVLEINSSMGFAIPFIGELYENMYKASFGHEVPTYIKHIIQNIKQEYTDHLWENWSSVLEKSHKPKKYIN